MKNSIYGGTEIEKDSVHQKKWDEASEAGPQQAREKASGNKL